MSTWPTRMRDGSAIALSSAMALTVVPFLAAIADSVSPDLTTYVRRGAGDGLGLGDGAALGDGLGEAERSGEGEGLGFG